MNNDLLNPNVVKVNNLHYLHTLAQKLQTMLMLALMLRCVLFRIWIHRYLDNNFKVLFLIKTSVSAHMFEISLENLKKMRQL